MKTESARFQTISLVCLVLALFCRTRLANAWVFPEHSQITETALKSLDQHDDDHDENDHKAKVALREILTEVAPLLHLCVAGRQNSCLPLAVLPSLAGDHSCTPADLYDLTRTQDTSAAWVADVLNVADDTQQKLLKAGVDEPEREAIRRQMHVDMQAKDRKYLARALFDFSHFQLARESRLLGHDGFRAYLQTALDPSAVANATASYVNYHWAALRLAAAARFARRDERAYWLTRALVTEAFALHFLEDSFATGHFVGHWGGDGVRLGTHDFYARAGIEAVRWGDSSTAYLAHGDAFMSDSERDVAAQAVAKSLSQVVLAATYPADTARLVGNQVGMAFDDYDSCTARTAPPGLRGLIDAPWLWEVLSLEPVPAARDPEVPRVRAEEGWFFGVSSSMQAGLAWPKAKAEALDVRVLGSVRGGYGAADIVNDPINSQAFLELGFVGEHLYGDAHSSLAGLALRVRAPGEIVFLDGIAAIVLANGLRGSCPACIDWAGAAASGGAGHIWKAQHLFDHVYGQVSLLRDFSVLVMRNEPQDGQYRYQLLASVLTARSALPIKGGTGITQSTDFYLDLGGSLVSSSSHSRTFGGVFASFSVAPRIFP